MKPTDRTREGQSNMGGERVGMTIDQSALAHIMSVLTDLYSDPELAVIREYSTNALDSHVEAGIKRPIEVTLPSPLSPFFRVRDYGVGLDADGIRDVYSQYGTSTKRESNDVVGMLGLGCKSALTYSDQFTLTGIKDGVMTQVSVSRDEDGGGSMTIVAQHETTDENGVEVIVPAKRHDQFEGKAHSFFKYWEPNTVLVNGEQPTRVDGLWLNDSLCLAKGLERSYVVMGNVAYPIPDEHNPAPKQDRYSNAHQVVVAFVPIGAIQFTPSREALQMTKLTQAALGTIKDEVQRLLAASIQDQITNATTAAEARAVAATGRSLGLKLDFSYKGHTVVDSLNRMDPDPVKARAQARDGADSFLVAGADSYRRKSGDRSLSITLEASYNRPTIWFKNFENRELTTTMREKMRAWAVRDGVTIENARLVLVDAYRPDERFWLDGNVVHDWADVAAIKLAKKERTLDSGRPKGSYKGRKDGQWSDSIVADTIDTTKPLLYSNGNRYSVQNEPEMRAQIIPADATLIALPSNRVDKFCRDFPTAKTFRDFGKEYADQYVKKQSEADLTAARFQMIGPSATRLKALDPALVNDPDLKVAITNAQRNVNTILEQVQQMTRWIGDFSLTRGKAAAVTNPAEKYPLLPMQFDVRIKEHIYLYLNAAYTAGRSA